MPRTDSKERKKRINIKKWGRSFIGLFTQFFKDLRDGDWAVRLSLLVMGTGYVARKQYMKGFLVTLLQGLFLWIFPTFFMPYLSKFSTLGTVMRAAVFNVETMKNEVNDFDHSFKILLFSIIGLVLLAVAIVCYFRNIRSVSKVYELQKEGKHIPTFREAVRSYKNEKFHVTLLMPTVIGVTVFTIVPLIVMILVAFTNYDQQHLPPSNLFTWVGFNNFKVLVGNSLSVTFGYSFSRVLTWTLIWAFFATFTNYYLGILLAMFINNKNTKAKKMWRSLFVVAIAVPQFVSLLLVRNFFADNGIVNAMFSQFGITDFLKSIGLVRQGLTYVPFLTDANWARVMIILINMWVGIPYLMLIATGVLLNIPADLTEAARIDGANAFQSFRNITMPYMRFVTGPYLITSFVANINNFNIIYLLTQDVYKTQDQFLANSNAKETDLLVTWLFRLTQDYYNYKMASVLGILIFVICAAFTVFAFSRTIKGDREERFQ